MTQDFTTAASPDQAHLLKMQSLNTVGTISYVLHLIVAVGAEISLFYEGQLGPTLMIVALLLDLVKSSDAQGTWHASHFRWRIRTVLIAAALYLVTAPLWFLLIAPGWIAWTIISIWFLYRIVIGFIAMNKGQPMPGAGETSA